MDAGVDRRGGGGGAAVGGAGGVAGSTLPYGRGSVRRSLAHASVIMDRSVESLPCGRGSECYRHSQNAETPNRGARPQGRFDKTILARGFKTRSCPTCSGGACASRFFPGNAFPIVSRLRFLRTAGSPIESRSAFRPRNRTVTIMPEARPGCRRGSTPSSRAPSASGDRSQGDPAAA